MLFIKHLVIKVAQFLRLKHKFNAMPPIASLCLVLCAIVPGQASATESPEPILTVFTYESFISEWGPGPKLKAAFEKQCQCKLNWLSSTDGVGLLNRLRLEGERLPADIVLGLDQHLLVAAKQLKLFAPHQQSLPPLTLPEPWQDKVFVPYDYGYFAFIYDTRKLKNPPQSLAELVKRDDIQVIYQDPRTSTPGQGLLLWMQQVFGAQATQAWQQLASHTVTVTKGWSEAYGMFLKGEADMVLSYTTSPAYHQEVEKVTHYQAAAFIEGHTLQVEVAAQLAQSKHPELARQFLAFLLSPNAQRIIATHNWMLPVRAIKQLPPAFGQLITPRKSLEMPLETIAKQRKQWLRQWRRAVSQ
ncbi:thiamine ABC transporter substrate binding subunit [Zooshikella ganghwensis]|nr:thiamine ABC transporter substrate binding subunit [Zooshikella ganghwensis]